eukprot:GHVS01039323.1.p1 GENE.GHVS01039323.1~~GHVS01039323.1.p1  ORF type:complete len:734 (+),score=175.79 GHVS01039323.1:113-2203(+)
MGPSFPPQQHLHSAHNNNTSPPPPPNNFSSASAGVPAPPTPAILALLQAQQLRNSQDQFMSFQQQQPPQAATSAGSSITVCSTPTTTDTHGWTEHLSKDGRRYYYNAGSGKSQWDKPDDLKSPEELKVSQQTPWKEYTTADGRTYWYNKASKQSVWNTPDVIKKLKAEEMEKEEEWTKFETKTEARDHMKILLEKKKLPARTKWEEALKILETDNRWASLTLLTKGEKKQLYSEYISQAQKRSQEEERKRRQQARESMLEFLTKWEQLTPATTFVAFADKCCDMSWWPDIEETEKDDMFQDFLDDFDSQYKERKRKRRKERLEMVRNIFEEHPSISFHTAWREVRELLQTQLEKTEIDMIDCLMVWQEFSKQGEAADRESRMSKIRRTERIRRDAFRDLMEDLSSRGQLTAKAEWVDTMKHVVEDPRYRDMVGQAGSTPRELFEDKIDELAEEYSKQKAVVKECVKTANLSISPKSTFEWFYESLRRLDAFSKVSIVNARFAFDSLLRKAVEKEQDELRKEGKQQKKLVELLNKLPEHDASIASDDFDDTSVTYEGAMQLIRNANLWENACELCGSEESRRCAYRLWLKLRTAGARDTTTSDERTSAVVAVGTTTTTVGAAATNCLTPHGGAVDGVVAVKRKVSAGASGGGGSEDGDEHREEDEERRRKRKKSKKEHRGGDHVSSSSHHRSHKSSK